MRKDLELHRCKVCGTRWLLWPDALLHGGVWNLLDHQQRPGACCDNAAMRDQIEHLRDIPLHAGAERTDQPADLDDVQLLEFWRSVNGPYSDLNGPLIRFAALVRSAALRVSQTTEIALGSRWRDNDPRLSGRAVVIVHVSSEKVSYYNRETDRLAVSHIARFRKAFSPEEPSASSRVPAPQSMDEAVAAFLEQMRTEAQSLPEGHEIRERGCSTFNWTTAIIRDFQKRLVSRVPARREGEEQ